MKRLTLLVLLLTVFSVQFASAQERAQKPEAPVTTNDSEQPKNEVERAIEEAKKNGDRVMALCIDNSCIDDPRQDDPYNLERGRALVLAKPKYPPIAAAAHASGEVRVKVLLGLDGNVIAASVVSGHPLLQSTSVRAARESVFSPTKLDGKPIMVVGVIVYNFMAQ